MRQRRRRRQLEDLRQPILRIQLEHLHVQLVERVLLRVPDAIRPAPVTSGGRPAPGRRRRTPGFQDPETRNRCLGLDGTGASRQESDAPEP